MLIVNRTITVDECPWLDERIEAGTKVHAFHGATYGCISETGIAVTFDPNVGPFFELPAKAVETVNEK